MILMGGKQCFFRLTVLHREQQVGWSPALTTSIPTPLELEFGAVSPPISFSSPTSFVASLVQFIVMGCADQLFRKSYGRGGERERAVVSREYRRVSVSLSAVCCNWRRFARGEHAAADDRWRLIANDLALRSRKEASAYPRTRIMYTVSKGPSKIVAKTRRGTKFGFLFRCPMLGY